MNMMKLPWIPFSLLFQSSSSQVDLSVLHEALNFGGKVKELSRSSEINFGLFSWTKVYYENLERLRLSLSYVRPEIVWYQI